MSQRFVKMQRIIRITKTFCSSSLYPRSPASCRAARITNSAAMVINIEKSDRYLAVIPTICVSRPTRTTENRSSIRV